MLTEATKTRVNDKIRACLLLAVEKYGRSFPMPRVIFTKRGRVAATANVQDNTINCNAILLSENEEEFISHTVPHELAHLIDFQLNPGNFQRTRTITRSGRYGWTKCDLHGKTWKAITVAIGGTPERCHSYDTTNSRVGRKTVKHAYTCKDCGTIMLLGNKAHGQMQIGSRRYYIAKTCKNHSGYVYNGKES